MEIIILVLSRPPQRSNECACLSRARARGNGLHRNISIETSSAKMAADLNFAVCVSFREDKPKTKQLFTLNTALKRASLLYIFFNKETISATIVNFLVEFTLS